MNKLITVGVALTAAAWFGTVPAHAAPSTTPQGPATPYELATGHTLRSGQSLVSGNGEYMVTMLSSGNLVETGLGQVLFSTKTQGHPGAYLVAQGDGNLVVRAAKTNRALWASGHRSRDTTGALLYNTGELAQFSLNPSGAFSVVVPPADLTVLPPGQRLSANQSLDSFSFNNLSIDLTMQADGNLVSSVVAEPVWATGTANHPGAYASMQQDGNFVVYSGAGLALWSTGTSGNPGARLVLQSSDDNLVVYSAANTALWSIQTGRIG